MFLLAESLGDPLRAWPRRCAKWCAALDANLPISNIRTMEELYRMRSVVILDVIVGDDRRDGR